MNSSVTSHNIMLYHMTSCNTTTHYPQHHMTSSVTMYITWNPAIISQSLQYPNSEFSVTAWMTRGGSSRCWWSAPCGSARPALAGSDRPDRCSLSPWRASGTRHRAPGEINDLLHLTIVWQLFGEDFYVVFSYIVSFQKVLIMHNGFMKNDRNWRIEIYRNK